MAVTPYIQFPHTSSSLSHFSPTPISSIKRTLSLNDVVSTRGSSSYRMTSSSKLRSSRSMPRISVSNSGNISDDDDGDKTSLSSMESHLTDSTVNYYIEMKANRLEIPFSLRMIKRIRQRRFEESALYGSDETAFCSVKTAFKSVVFIIGEIHTCYANQLRAILFCDGVTTVGKVQYEMMTSLVWLFQKVYSHTPSLMVYVMILLANFTVYSLTRSSTVRDVDTWGNVGRVIVQRGEEEEEEEGAVWESMVEEASRMKREVRGETLDEETAKRFVSPVRVEIETDGEYEEYFRTGLVYQTWLKRDSDNVMVLANYAQFLYLIVRDFDRAEEYFKRAIEMEPKDAIALERYAYFLWHVRKDLWAAEEIFLEAIATDPDNEVHLYDYAHFLWQTGNNDTCFPTDDRTTFQIDG